MEHLKPEELARLVDEAPDAIAAEHLESCGACEAALSSLRAQTMALSGLPDLSAPPAAWGRISGALEAERRFHRPSGAGYAALLRAAAAVAIFIGGSVVGTFVVAPRMSVAAPRPAAVPAPQADAARALQAAESQYVEAVTRFAEVAELGDGLDPLNRLAVLEGIVLTTRAALREAPADPVINSYHLTALGQKEALIRQLERLEADDEWF